MGDCKCSEFLVDTGTRDGVDTLNGATRDPIISPLCLRCKHSWNSHGKNAFSSKYYFQYVLLDMWPSRWVHFGGCFDFSWWAMTAAIQHRECIDGLTFEYTWVVWQGNHVTNANCNERNSDSAIPLLCHHNYKYLICPFGKLFLLLQIFTSSHPHILVTDSLSSIQYPRFRIQHGWCDMWYTASYTLSKVRYTADIRVPYLSQSYL